MAAYLGLLVAGGLLLQPRQSPVVSIVYVIVLSAIFIAICWWKGEPPKWRWGSK